MRPDIDGNGGTGIEGDEFTVRLDDDLKRYLSFLENSHLIRDREEAILAALRIFKKLNMHEWLSMSTALATRGY